MLEYKTSCQYVNVLRKLPNAFMTCKYEYTC